MLVTEKDARLKWCPAARVVEMLDDGEAVEGYPVGNRSTGHHGHPHARCIASDCMWWRWNHPNKDGEGYCGMAGLPYKLT